MSDSAEQYDVPALKARLLAQLGANAASYPQNIEREFPRILARLTELWGTEGLGPYIDSLTFSDRPERHGFPPEVATELFRLSNLHQSLHPASPPSGTSWEKTDSADLIERPRKKKHGH